MTYEEVFATKEFVDFYRQDLNKVFFQRKAILDKGGNLKDDVYRQLREMGLLEQKQMIAEFYIIQQKKSNLSSNQRAFVADVIMRCVYKTLMHFEEQAKNRIENVIQK